MKSFPHQTIQDILRPMEQSGGAEYVQKVTDIVAYNFQNGRVDLGDPELEYQEKIAKIQAYTLRVVKFYDLESSRVEALQIRQDSVLWEALYQQLYQWAWYSIGRKWPSVSYGQRAQLASEIAPEAGLRILSSYFFYDTPFDAWVRMIVWNVTYEVMRRYIRDSKRTVQLADDDAYEQELPSAIGHQETVLQIDSIPHLQKAIGNLSEKQRNVIVFHYIDGLSLAEIAENLQADPNNIYQLHYQGLKNLRRQLT